MRSTGCLALLVLYWPADALPVTPASRVPCPAVRLASDECGCTDDPPFVRDPIAREPVAADVAALVEQLKVRSCATAAGAARRLGRLGKQAPARPLVDVLTHSSCRVRVAAAEALGEIGDATARRPLERSLRDVDPRVRAVSAWSLGKMPDRGSLPGLVRALGDADKHVRQGAAASLGNIRDPRAAPALTRALHDPEKQVRQAAADALGQLGSAVPPTSQSGASPLVIRHATLIDGTGESPRRGMTIVIDARRIARIGQDGSVLIPAGARVVDATGRYLIPGLWDMHSHLVFEGATALAMYVASGVTTVRDMGGSIDSIRAWRAAIRAGERIGPRIIAAGPMLESAASVQGIRAESDDSTITPPDRVIVPDPASAQRIVDSIAALGVDFLKIRTYENPPTYWAIAAAARRRGIVLMGHPPFGLDPIAVADSGQRSFEHGFFPWKVDSIRPDSLSRIERAIRAHDIALVPTIGAWDVRRIPLDSLARSVDGPTAESHRWRGVLAPSLLDKWRKELKRFARENSKHEPKANLATWNRVLDGLAHDMAVLRAAGNRVLPGSDLPVGRYPGEALHAELESLVLHGVMTPAQAIESATRSSAEFMGAQDSLGTVAVGKIADMVLLAGDPTLDIRNIRRVEAVVVGGVLLTDVGQLPFRAKGVTSSRE